MWNFLKNERAQSTAEYAIVIALVIGAAVAMQTYVKRSMQGSIKFAVDKLQRGETSTGKGQYEPYYSASHYDVSTSGYKDTVKTEDGGKVTRAFGVGTAKTTTRSGEQSVLDISHNPDTP